MMLFLVLCCRTAATKAVNLSRRDYITVNLSQSWWELFLTSTSCVRETFFNKKRRLHGMSCNWKEKNNQKKKKQNKTKKSNEMTNTTRQISRCWLVFSNLVTTSLKWSLCKLGPSCRAVQDRDCPSTCRHSSCMDVSRFTTSRVIFSWVRSATSITRLVWIQGSRLFRFVFFFEHIEKKKEGRRTLEATGNFGCLNIALMNAEQLCAETPFWNLFVMFCSVADLVELNTKFRSFVTAQAQIDLAPSVDR